MIRREIARRSQDSVIREKAFGSRYQYYHPTPWGSLYEYQRKRLSKIAVCKLLKIKGRFAQQLRSDAHWQSAYSYPPTPGVCRIDLKGKGLQIGMLEVVENKGGDLHLNGTGMRFGATESSCPVTVAGSD